MTLPKTPLKAKQTQRINPNSSYSRCNARLNNFPCNHTKPIIVRLRVVVVEQRKVEAISAIDLNIQETGTAGP